MSSPSTHHAPVEPHLGPQRVADGFDDVHRRHAASRRQSGQHVPWPRLATGVLSRPTGVKDRRRPIVPAPAAHALDGAHHDRHDASRMFWILIIVLTVLGGGAAAMAVSRRGGRKALPSGGSKALPGGDQLLLDRTVRDLRVGDVLTLDGRDFLVEGVVGYDEDGHRWTGGRIVDGSDERWLIVGLERTGGAGTRVLTVDRHEIAGYPPESLLLGEVRFSLDKRGTATCKVTGDVGGLGNLKSDRPAAHVERCRWWLYSAPGEDTLIVEQWGADYRVLRGKKVSEATIDLMPGS
jgi:hypothetical protein